MNLFVRNLPAKPHNSPCGRVGKDHSEDPLINPARLAHRHTVTVDRLTRITPLAISAGLDLKRSTLPATDEDQWIAVPCAGGFWVPGTDERRPVDAKYSASGRTVGVSLIQSQDKNRKAAHFWTALCEYFAERLGRSG